jgi:hypothetical protein
MMIKAGTIKEIFDHMLKQFEDHIALGPLLPGPKEEGGGWGMLIAGGVGGKFYCNILALVDTSEEELDRDDYEAVRRIVIVDSAVEIQKRAPSVRVHVFDDELAMARWCAETWVEDYTARIAKRIEQKYAERMKELH